MEIAMKNKMILFMSLLYLKIPQVPITFNDHFKCLIFTLITLIH